MSEITEKLTAALADRYRFERHLGEGGMANVYLAHDLKHDRKVAVKVLRPELAAMLGAERFVQEIATTARLQHPHILPLFDSGQVGGFLYYVMPFIDGETLRQKLNRETQLSIQEAVRIAREVADALDYAHRQGVIHRDIKPENILLHDGRPMVADFGIALAVSAAAGGRMTETGLSLGTPHYMSPEQATAEKEITSRSDVYSLGAVLYEMLAGEPPHSGASAQAIVMKIITDDVRPVTELRKSVPPHVAAATATALEKLVADRFDSAAKFAEALADPGFTLAMPRVGTTGAVAGRRWTPTTIGLVGAVAVLAVVAAMGWLRSGPVAEPVTRQEIVLWNPESTPPTWAVRRAAAVAPDGSALVFADSVGDGLQLVVKPRNQNEPIPLSGTDNGVNPFFSPDGAWLGFVAGGRLRKVPVGGGASIMLADSANEGAWGSGAWLDDGTIVYVSVSFDLNRVAEEGGASSLLVPSASVGRFLIDPFPLPGSRGILFIGCNTGCAASEVYVYDFAADSATMLFEDAYGVWYVPTGHVLYGARSGGIFAAPFDPRSLRVTGPAVPVLDDVVAPNLQVSTSGAVLYRVGGPIAANPSMATAVWVDRQGRVTEIDPSWRFDAGASNRGIALSPDETRVVVRARTDGNFDIWVKELPRGPFSRLTTDPAQDRKPVWSPDGRSVLFLSDRSGSYDVWQRRADGTGSDEPVLQDDRFVAWAEMSLDGSVMLLRTGGTAGVEGGRDILVYRPGLDTIPSPLLAGQFDEWGPALSPDGKWLAYVSTEAGRPEVFVRPFPDVESGRTQISRAGGEMPLWAHSGRELFYLGAERQMMAAQVTTSPEFRVVERTPMFTLGREFASGAGQGHYSVSRDDQRFLMIRHVIGEQGEGDAPRYILVYNWFEELKEKVGRE